MVPSGISIPTVSIPSMEIVGHIVKKATAGTVSTHGHRVGSMR
jgi:hypothetical protein